MAQNGFSTQVQRGVRIGARGGNPPPRFKQHHPGGDLYYVRYTKSIGPYLWKDKKHHSDDKMWSWDYAEIWNATSTDGINWQEKGCAVPRGLQGAYDERTVCTADVLTHEGKYYLVYQAARIPCDGGNETVGMSTADSLDGPWSKTPAPVLKPMESGRWFGENSG